MQLRADPALPGLSRLLLDPLSLLFKAASYAGWRIKGLRRRPFPDMFIISVDGLSFGGSGKTPLVAAIGRSLEARGARFAIVSRGYRSRHEKTGLRVELEHTSGEVGDEPRLLKGRFPGQEVFIGRDRLRSIAAAAARNLRIIILDDGFQSSHIRKDFSIMLVNPAHPYFYLRHFRFQARRADRTLYLRPGAPESGDAYDFAISGFRDPSGREAAVGREPLVAFAALGDNERFASDMRRFNLAAFRPFPDHHAYTLDDLRSLEALRREKGAAWLVCTEKDFGKIRDLLGPAPLAGEPAGARQRALQGVPLLRAQNEIQLPRDLLEQIVTHASEKGFI